MAELNFTENEGKYVAEVKVTADFNLHIEREGSGFLNVSVRTTEDGAYDSVKGASFNYADPVVDCDFTGVIYPKYIKIVSKVQPTKAVITSAGEVTEIKQSNLKEGDVLYYKKNPPMYENLGIAKSDLSGLVDGITQLAVGSYMNHNSGNSYSNKYWDSWNLRVNENGNWSIYDSADSPYMLESLAGLKFVVGSDKLSFFDAALAQTGASVEDKYVEITAEEYANIFNV